MSDLVDLIRRVRRRSKDFPNRLLLQDNPLTAAAVSMTILAGDVGKLKDSGTVLNFDDATDELVLTTAAAAGTSVGVARGQDGTAPSEHVIGTAVLIRPRFTNAEIIERLVDVVEGELWPHVWLAGETSVTYQGVNEYYDPTVPDIEEIVYAYQLSGGRRYELHAEFLSPELADDANFPDGAITIREAVDSGKIYLAYRARPSLGTLTSMLENLTVTGTLAQLVMDGEAAHVGGATTAVSKQVQDGSALRAGAVMWDRFEKTRIQERIRLQSEEQAARRHFFGSGRG